MRGILYTIYMVLGHIHQCLTLEKKITPKTETLCYQCGYQWLFWERSWFFGQFRLLYFFTFFIYFKLNIKLFYPVGINRKDVTSFKFTGFQLSL